MKEKHIFIGLGGSGCTTVANLKYKIYEKCPEQDKARFLADNYRFLFIDTDPADIDRANRTHRNDFEHGKEPFINPRTEMIDLGKGNPAAIYHEAATHPETMLNSRILEACSPELAALIPDQQLAFGAGAFRMKSRLSFARSLADFQQKLEAAINSLNNVKTTGGDTNRIFYWVVSSTNGGTGSGIVNDVLYYVNAQHKQSVSDSEPYLVLVQYMPKAYIDANPTNDKYALNAFAVLQEEEGIKSWSKDPERNKLFHRLALIKDYNLIDKTLPYNPFYFMIPVDYQTDKETTLGDPNTMYRNTAEMLYYVHSGEGGAQFRSDLDNYMNDILMKNRKAFLVPMGYIAVRKPEQEFLNYMNMRFKYELLKYGLLDEHTAVVNKEEAEEQFKTLFSPILPSGKPDTFAGTVMRKANEYRDENYTPVPGMKELATKDTVDTQFDEFNRENINRIFAKFDVDHKDIDSGKITKIDVGATASIERVENSIWEAAEGYIRTKGLQYAKNMISQLRKLAKQYVANVNKMDFIGKKPEDLDGWDDLQKKYDAAVEITLREKTIGSNENDVKIYLDAANEFFGRLVDNEVMLKCSQMVEIFCFDDTSDHLSKIEKHLQALINNAQQMQVPARDAFTDVAKEFNKRAMDVTSVYLPSLQAMVSGNEWASDNFFSKLYGEMITPTAKIERGVGRVPYREDQINDPSVKSIEGFLERYVYGQTSNHDSKAYKLIKEKNFLYTDDGKVSARFFCVPDQGSSTTKTAKTTIEDFLGICAEIFEEEFKNNQKIQENWLNKSIYRFFDELSTEEKDKLRRRLDPSIFFSYKQNRLQDISEGRIYVAESEIVAEKMLGKTSQQGGHDKFALTQENNAAFIIKFRYGMQFSDYRVYDTLRSTYEAATFREKYHFHRLFAEYGEELKPENLPVESDAQHQTFAKLLLLNEFLNMGTLSVAPTDDDDIPQTVELKDLFYSPEGFSWMKKNYAQSIINLDPAYIKMTGAISVAMPEAVSMKEDKLSICRKDGERDLFVELPGRNFKEYYESFEKEFNNRRFDETVNRFIKLLRNYNYNKISASEVLRYNFEEAQNRVLDWLNDQIEKGDESSALFKSLFFIVQKMDVNLLK